MPAARIPNKVSLLQIIIIILAILTAILFAKFIYKNVIVTWPYRNELKACLKEAGDYSTKSQKEDARDKCFRQYPHFL